MTKETLETIFRSAIDHYGPGLQMTVAIEELSELQKELCKVLRDHGKIENLIEEIADVEIMLFQIKTIFEISEEDLNKEKGKKAARTLGRILDDEYRAKNDDIQR